MYQAKFTGPALREPLTLSLPTVIQKRLSYAEPIDNDNEGYQQVVLAGRGQEHIWKTQKKHITAVKSRPTACPSNTKPQDKKFSSVKDTIKSILQNMVEYCRVKT